MPGNPVNKIQETGPTALKRLAGRVDIIRVSKVAGSESNDEAYR